MAFSSELSRLIVSNIVGPVTISLITGWVYADKKGISKRFLNYFNQFDQSVGARALGENQTLTGKAQDLLSGATTQARGVDKQKGYSKIAHDVRFCLHRMKII